MRSPDRAKDLRVRPEELARLRGQAHGARRIVQHLPELLDLYARVLTA